MNQFHLVLVFILIILIAICIALYGTRSTISGGNTQSRNYSLISFPPEEYHEYKRMLDNHEESGTTRVSQQYGLYKLGHVYRTDPRVGHLILVTRIDELKDISEHPRFNYLDPRDIKTIRKYQKHGLQHITFIGVTDDDLTFYDNDKCNELKFREVYDGKHRQISHYFYKHSLGSTPWHLYLEVHYDPERSTERSKIITKYFKHNVHGVDANGRAQRFYEHLELQQNGYLRDTLRMGSPYCKYEFTTDGDGNHYLTVHKYDPDDMHQLSSEYIKNGLIMKEIMYDASGASHTIEYPEGKAIDLYDKPSDQPKELMPDISTDET